MLSPWLSLALAEVPFVSRWRGPACPPARGSAVAGAWLRMKLLQELTPALTLSISRIDCQWLKNRSLSTLKVSSQAPKPHLLLLLFSPFHYPFLFIRTSACCFEMAELGRNLLRLSMPIFSSASDAEKLCLRSWGAFVCCCIPRMCPVRWRCVPPSYSLARARFGEQFCTAWCCSALSATTIACRACVSAGQKGAWVTGTQVCVVCACLGLSTLKQGPVGLEMGRARKDGILLEHGPKQGRV